MSGIDNSQHKTTPYVVLNDEELRTVVSNSQDGDNLLLTPRQSALQHYIAYLKPWTWTPEERWDAFLFSCTVLSPVPQGLFAALLVNKELPKHTNIDPTSLMFCNIIAFLTAEFGKVAVINYFNSRDRDADILKSELSDQPTKITLRNSVQNHFKEFSASSTQEKLWAAASYPSSVIVSGVFSALAVLSMMATAQLAREHDTPFAKFLDDMCSSLVLKFILIAANFFCNVIAFPNLNNGIYFQSIALWNRVFGALDGMLGYSDTYQNYLNKQAHYNAIVQPILTEMNAVIVERKQSKHNLDSNGFIGFDTSLTRINKSLSKLFDAGALGLAEIQLSNFVERIPGSKAWQLKSNIFQDICKRDMRDHTSAITNTNYTKPLLARDLFATVVTLAIVGTTIAGLSNFFDIAHDVSQLAMGKSAAAEGFAQLFSYIDMLEMAALGAISTIGYAYILAGWCQASLQNPSLQLINRTRLNAIYAAAWTVAILGAMPNVYQSLVIANQPEWLITSSGAASIFIEVLPLIHAGLNYCEKGVQKQLIEQNALGGGCAVYAGINSTQKALILTEALANSRPPVPPSAFFSHVKDSIGSVMSSSALAEEEDVVGLGLDSKDSCWSKIWCCRTAKPGFTRVNSGQNTVINVLVENAGLTLTNSGRVQIADV